MILDFYLLKIIQFYYYFCFNTLIYFIQLIKNFNYFIIFYILDFKFFFYNLILEFSFKLSDIINFSYLTFKILLSVTISICILISVAFFTLLERKKLGSFHNRIGPNNVGFLGLFQAIADGVKLILKESILPRSSNLTVFLLSPILAFFFGLAGWAIIPFSYSTYLVNLNYSILFIFIISIFHIYGVILAGWSSNSRYSFLGALRSSAQLISYDISIGLILLNIFLCTKSLNILNIIEYQDFNGWFIWYLFLPFLLFLVCALAETNRHPFDLPEAESELVSGYNVEYSAMGFALFFLGEYSAILFTSVFITIIFLGAWLPLFNILSFIPPYIWFTSKVLLVNYFFFISRAVIPRYRYDQLMRIGWKFILPLALGFFILNFSIFFISNSFIINYLSFVKILI